jgi:hypothetical protein
MAWDDLSPHTQALLKWATHTEAKQNAPPSAAQTIYPHLRSEARPAPVERREGNVVSAAAALFPNLRRQQQ